MCRWSDVDQLIDLRVAVFTAEAQLMSSETPGKGFVDMTSDVVATLGRGLADDLEAADVDVRRVRVGRVGDEAERVHIEAGLLIVEDLVEVVHSDRDLVGDVRRDSPVVHE